MKEQDEIKITKVVKAGSFAKFTILRKTHEDPVDVDVVFIFPVRMLPRKPSRVSAKKSSTLW